MASENEQAVCPECGCKLEMMCVAKEASPYRCFSELTVVEQDYVQKQTFNMLRNEPDLVTFIIESAAYSDDGWATLKLRFLYKLLARVCETLDE